jgi:hypothetical protein
MVTGLQGYLVLDVVIWYLTWLSRTNSRMFPTRGVEQTPYVFECLSSSGDGGGGWWWRYYVGPLAKTTTMVRHKCGVRTYRKL